MIWTDYWEEVITGTIGATGASGASANRGAWATPVTYAAGDKATHARSGHGLSVYDCILGHVSSALNEPETGANRATYWVLGPEGGTNGAGSGDTIGPASSVTGNLPAFADTAGKLLVDSGIAQSAINFDSLVASTATPALTDEIRIWVASLSAYRKITIANFRKKNESILISAASIWKTLTLPCGDTNFFEPTTNKWAVIYVPFSNVAKSYANVQWIMPTNYDGGTVTIEFHWTLHTATNGTACFGCAARCVGDGESLDAAPGTAVEVVDTSFGAVDRECQSAPSVAMTIAGTPAGGKKILFQIYRDPTKDSLAESVYLTGLKLTYGVTG
jgi:hypothetical protein